MEEKTYFKECYICNRIQKEMSLKQGGQSLGIITFHRVKRRRQEHLQEHKRLHTRWGQEEREYLQEIKSHLGEKMSS